MIISEAFPFTLKKQPAQMYVVRNDGFCWGRLVLEDGTEYDVESKRDRYDYDDDEAAASFIYLAKRGMIEEPMSSWRIGGED